MVRKCGLSRRFEKWVDAKEAGRKHEATLCKTAVVERNRKVDRRWKTTGGPWKHSPKLSSFWSWDQKLGGTETERKCPRKNGNSKRLIHSLHTIQHTEFLYACLVLLMEIFSEYSHKNVWEERKCRVGCLRRQIGGIWGVRWTLFERACLLCVGKARHKQ